MIAEITLITPKCDPEIAPRSRPCTAQKFLLDKDGKPVRRYSRYYDTNDIAADIEKLL